MYKMIVTFLFDAFSCTIQQYWGRKWLEVLLYRKGFEYFPTVFQTHTMIFKETPKNPIKNLETNMVFLNIRKIDTIHVQYNNDTGV